uniref:Transcription factor bHLH79 isoform X1 n=1 Tax=Rhizophora mucronata TaxID=61149 RepID=A0A2P2IZK3_RHIMU
MAACKPTTKIIWLGRSNVKGNTKKISGKSSAIFKLTGFQSTFLSYNTLFGHKWLPVNQFISYRGMQ